MIIYAYKLLRKRKDGSLGSLFVGRSFILKKNINYMASTNLPHKGLAYRPGFHCCSKPIAPHLKMTLSNGEQRVWAYVELDGEIEKIKRPECQGGIWYVSSMMKILKILD